MKTNTKPPYRLVADSIREKVLAGEYALGKLPSERALIRQRARASWSAGAARARS